MLWRTLCTPKKGLQVGTPSSCSIAQDVRWEGVRDFPYYVGLENMCILLRNRRTPHNPKRPTQPYLRQKIGLRSGIWAAFFCPPPQYFSVGRDWFLYRKQAARKANATKCSADALILDLKSDQKAACPTCTKSHIYIYNIYMY